MPTRVALIDDMLAKDKSTLTGRDLALLDAFKRGWCMGHVPTVDEVIEGAPAYGFEIAYHRDLDEFLWFNQPWDRFFSWVAPPLDWLGLARVPMFANLIGGNALTQCHRRGLVRYAMVVMRMHENVSCDFPRTLKTPVDS